MFHPILTVIPFTFICLISLLALHNNGVMTCKDIQVGHGYFLRCHKTVSCMLLLHDTFDFDQVHNDSHFVHLAIFFQIISTPVFSVIEILKDSMWLKVCGYLC